jgi:hypothetical protein
MKKANLLKVCLAALCAFSSSLTVQAKKTKVFYDVHQSVGVIGDYQKLVDYGYKDQIVDLKVQMSTTAPDPTKDKKGFSKEQLDETLNSLKNEGIGNKVLKHFFLGSDGKLTEDILKERFGKDTFSHMDENEKVRRQEDYLSTLANNYVYLEHPTSNGIAYMVFHVAIDQNVLNEVYATWDNPKGIDNINVPIELIAYSTAKSDENYNKINADIAKKVAPFAICGVVDRPYVEVDKRKGVEKGDIATIYSQRMDKNGVMYSKRISRARVSEVEDYKSHIFSIAGTRGNRKDGDIAVITHEKNMSVALEGVGSIKLGGVQGVYDMIWGITRSGIMTHMIATIGLITSDSETNDTYSVEGSSAEFSAPQFINIGAGYGVSKVFAGFVEVMPYFLFQIDYASMSNSQNVSGGTKDPDYENIQALSLGGLVGVRCDINISYPWQLTLSGGYAHRFGINSKSDYRKSYDSIQQVLDQLDAKRNGLFLSLGVKWHF